LSLRAARPDEHRAAFVVRRVRCGRTIIAPRSSFVACGAAGRSSRRVRSFVVCGAAGRSSRRVFWTALRV
jgi:hypothetical protein